MLDKQQARPASFPKEPSMQIMQIPTGKAGSGMKKEPTMPRRRMVMKGERKAANHLEEFEGDYLMKGREIVFHLWENKTERGSRDVRNTRE